MTKQRNAIEPVLPIETWNEELSRLKKYKEATQKRKAEKQARKQIESVNKTNRVGRLKIEP